MAQLALHGARLFASIPPVISTRNQSVNGVTLMLKLDMSLLMKLGIILVWTMTFHLLTRLQDVKGRVSWAMAIHQTYGLHAASRICKLITSQIRTIGAWTVSFFLFNFISIRYFYIICLTLFLLYFEVAPSACDGSGTIPVTSAPPKPTPAPASSTCDVSQLFGPINGSYVVTVNSK